MYNVCTHTHTHIGQICLIYIYIYIYIYVYTCKHTYIHTYKQTYIPTYSTYLSRVCGPRYLEAIMGHDENMLLLRRGYGQYGQPLQITLSAMTPLDEAVQRYFFLLLWRQYFFFITKLAAIVFLFFFFCVNSFSFSFCVSWLVASPATQLNLFFPSGKDFHPQNFFWFFF